jgi:hypothetical protein
MAFLIAVFADAAVGDEHGPRSLSDALSGRA